MDSVGWAAVVVAAIGGAAWILRTLFEMVPPLCRLLVDAIRAIREVRTELQGSDPTASGQEPPGQSGITPGRNEPLP